MPSTPLLNTSQLSTSVCFFHKLPWLYFNGFAGYDKGIMLSKRYTRYLIVGVFNTLSNLVWFNLLLFLGHMSVWLANALSLVISISLSFLLNHNWVFERAHKKPTWRNFALFFAVSLAVQIVAQQIVLSFFTSVWPAPGHLAYDVVHPALNGVTQRFMVVNTAKLLAVAVSLVSNYLLYSRFIFVDDKPTR
jgi:putative flippase GtrA